MDAPPESIGHRGTRWDAADVTRGKQYRAEQGMQSLPLLIYSNRFGASRSESMKT